MTRRPPIPESIKREVRQRCGFGCAICGCPIYDYDHIVEYSEVAAHEASNLTLLCATHHRAKTSGRLTRRRVELADAAPRNRQHLLSGSTEVTYDLSTMVVHLGSVVFLGVQGQCLQLLNVDGTEVIALEQVDGWLTLNLRLFDEDNRPVLLVKNGQLRHATDRFDIQFVGQRLTIHGAAREIMLDMTFSPEKGIAVDRGEWWAHGYHFKVSQDQGFECLSAGQKLPEITEAIFTVTNSCAVYKGDQQLRPRNLMIAINLGDAGDRSPIAAANHDPGPVIHPWIDAGPISDLFNG